MALVGEKIIGLFILDTIKNVNGRIVDLSCFSNFIALGTFKK
ncbi:hypothetical protein [Haliovirga abyssi]|uniref:Uncharacterized protein n=1 Tax=Haliovirga abyssi TaxID=2996794 RepID=A0AAU9E590_9FUSO|nr:hypothetical protein [Haliovirga abyssi]BDU51705.1 hypothetical protein HLVA_22740 [Haliovirga abyssi]